MAKTCIICGQSTGSKEHVFPAALGGRRVNKKIYCEKHNNNFGNHVATLEAQLSLLNALVGVRSDHHGTPKPFEFMQENYHKLSLLETKIQITPPPSLKSLGAGATTTMSLEFSDIKQFEAWKAAQQRDGFKVLGNASDAALQRRHFVEPVHFKLQFGGPAGLQAIGYLALTFFAHFFQEHARDEQLREFKDYLMLDLSNSDPDGVKPNFVWWHKQHPKDILTENPFKFGHTVAVGVSNSTHHAHAFISLFSSLNFAIDLGPISTPQEEMVFVFIDPTADKAPEDWVIARSNFCSITASPSMDDLSHIIHSGWGQAALSELFNKIAEFHYDMYIDELNLELDAWRLEGSINPKQFAGKLVEKHSQRVLNTLVEMVAGLPEHLKTNSPQLVGLAHMLCDLIKSDNNQPNGLAMVTTTLFQCVQAVILYALTEELNSPHITANRIAEFIDGAESRRLIVNHIIPQVLYDLASHQSSQSS